MVVFWCSLSQRVSFLILWKQLKIKIKIVYDVPHLYWKYSSFFLINFKKINIKKKIIKNKKKKKIKYEIIIVIIKYRIIRGNLQNNNNNNNK